MDFKIYIFSKDILEKQNFEKIDYDLDKCIELLSTSISSITTVKAHSHRKEIFNFVCREILAWKILNSKSSIIFKSTEEWDNIKVKENTLSHFLLEYKRYSEILLGWFGPGYVNVIKEIANLILEDNDSIDLHEDIKHDLIGKALDKYPDNQKHYVNFISN